MGDDTSLTVQIHHHAAWHDAADLAVSDVQVGIRSPTRLDYDPFYFIAFGNAELAEGRPVTDWRAVSVRDRVDMATHRRDHWPPFLLDLLPQGHARRRLAGEMRFDPDDEGFALPLLLRGAGNPVGNVRIKQAYEAEQERLSGETVAGVTLDEVFDRSPAFQDMAGRFALIASGSSGVQGEWPKLLLTRKGDGLWYPDSLVGDDEARDHIIVKMSRAKGPEDRLILACEAPYLEIARGFGLRVGRPMIHRGDTLAIPRFDRAVSVNGVTRLGQESLVSAAGVAAFGHQTTHEAYIAVLHAVCTEPAGEIIEYVLRDLLNRAMGDTDNHGRNTALQKRSDGWIGLTPRFDFAPMVLDPGIIAPSTRWECLRGSGFPIRFERICEAAAAVTGNEGVGERLAGVLSAKADAVAALPETARIHGVPEPVIARAFAACGELAAALAALPTSGSRNKDGDAAP
ncbi:hipA domain protein (plasmid) [Azospirillum sp. B510]|uniref:type II toxin-antitoxin system HipA family toxin n=1 Tax=Azospirillum sp. (strain B510) TaxID=137722 RepID=UPI0001C4CF1F|nr:HipA domain-containing protein [Azospirillum sp. B510]BAI76792.1 hipA domain protein [Azospirillum sp. B510]